VLSCTFAEGVNPKESYIRVFEATGDGGEVDLGNSQVSFSNVHQMTVGLPKLPKGQYLLGWFTISAGDDHKAGGSFTFTIK
jgi:methionine-rich copper-binding protein CopC